MYFITSFNNIPLQIPCGIWNCPPNLCDNEWTIPRKALANAIPAIHEALAIFSFALTALTPNATDSGKYWRTILIASNEYGFVYSVAITDTYDSIACVKASTPEATVNPLGIVNINSGSLIATSGVNS